MTAPLTPADALRWAAARLLQNIEPKKPRSDWAKGYVQALRDSSHELIEAAAALPEGQEAEKKYADAYMSGNMSVRWQDLSDPERNAWTARLLPLATPPSPQGAVRDTSETDPAAPFRAFKANRYALKRWTNSGDHRPSLAPQGAVQGGDARDTVVAEIAAERQRQISAEGWTPEHDDEHADRSMAQVAMCYVEQYVWRAWLCDCGDGSQYRSDDVPRGWPDSWDTDAWKPKNPRRDLVRAAALIGAEIERIDRVRAASDRTGDAGGDHA